MKFLISTGKYGRVHIERKYLDCIRSNSLLSYISKNEIHGNWLKSYVVLVLIFIIVLVGGFFSAKKSSEYVRGLLSGIIISAVFFLIIL